MRYSSEKNVIIIIIASIFNRLLLDSCPCDSLGYEQVVGVLMQCGGCRQLITAQQQQRR